MSALPASGHISNASRTVAEMKVDLEELRDAAAELPGGSARTELTIATGAIVPPDGAGGGVHTVDTEGNAASDDLDSITTTNTPDGRIIRLYAENTARVVTVKHGSGNLQLEDATDLALTDLEMWIEFQRRSSTWVEYGRHYKPFGFHATPSSDQSGVATSTWTDVACATETYDINGCFSTPTFTAPRACDVIATWCVVTLTGLADQNLLLTRLNKNSGTIVASDRRTISTATTVAAASSGAATLRLAKGDTLKLQAFHNLGSNVQLDAAQATTGEVTFFSVMPLRH